MHVRFYNRVMSCKQTYVQVKRLVAFLRNVNGETVFPRCETGSITPFTTLLQGTGSFRGVFIPIHFKQLPTC